MTRREDCAQKIIKAFGKNTADAKIGLLVMDDALNGIGRMSMCGEASTFPYWKEEIADIIIECYPEIAEGCDGIHKYCKDTINRRLIVSDHKSPMAMAMDTFANPKFADLTRYDGVTTKTFRFCNDADVLYAMRFMEEKFGGTVSPHISPMKSTSECHCKVKKPILTASGACACSKCGRNIALDNELTFIPNACGPIEDVRFKTNFTKDEITEAFRLINNGVTSVESIGEIKVYTMVSLLSSIEGIYPTVEVDKKLYVYSNSEDVLDSIARARTSHEMPLTPVSKTEYMMGRNFMGTYDRLMRLNDYADLDNLEARMELKNELFYLFCAMIVQNSQWREKDKDGISDKYLDELTGLYLANTNILPTKQSRNDIAFKAFFEFAQDEEDIDAVTFGNNPKGGFTRFIQLDDMGIIDVGMRNNFFYHYLSVEYGSQMIESDPLTDPFMAKFKVVRVDRQEGK